MSFKVEIEIKPYSDKWCMDELGNGCNGCDDEYSMCYIFYVALEAPGGIFTHRCMRCPQCLEAEKEYQGRGQ